MADMKKVYDDLIIINLYDVLANQLSKSSQTWRDEGPIDS